MAASNWHLLVSKVKASTVKDATSASKSKAAAPQEKSGDGNRSDATDGREEEEEEVDIMQARRRMKQSAVQEPANTDVPRSSRGGTSAKLISMSVWDTHDGDKTLRPSARRVFWDLDSKEQASERARESVCEREGEVRESCLHAY
nr:hypothetical protein BaRGS_021158 [Batillaria attramentaria]